MEFGMVKEEGGRQQQTEDIRKSKFELQYDCTVLFSTKFYPIHHLYSNISTCLFKQVNKPYSYNEGHTNDPTH